MILSNNTSFNTAQLIDSIIPLLQMNPEGKALPILKIRSKSMPIINSFNNSHSHPKFKVNKPKLDDKPGQQSEQHHHIIQLQHLKDKEKQQLNNKLKVLAERSTKKLQYKYQTIDRWKQKYVPQSSILLIKHKLSLDHHSSPTNKQENKSGNKLKQVSLKAFPSIGEEKLGLPNYKQQGKKLEQLLRDRLNKNKKYYELNKTILQKQMVFFDNMNIFISPEKKRQLELRMLIIKSEKQQAGSRGLFYKKISLEPLSDKKQKQKQKLIKRIQMSPRQNLNQMGLCDIRDLKSKLLDEVLGTTPEGWDTIDQLQSPQDEAML